MKSKQFLSVLLGTTLLFAACSNDEANKTEDTSKQTQTENKKAQTPAKEVKASANLIEKAKTASKDIKSYHAALDATMESDGSKNEVIMDLSTDDKNQTKIDNNADNQQTTLYLFDDKVIANQDGKQFLDVTKVMGENVDKQIEQVQYQSFINSLDIFKSAQYKKTKDGYVLTKTYNNIEEYKKMAKDVGSEDLIKTIEKQLKDIKGTETITFDNQFLVKSSKKDVVMKFKDKKIKTLTSISYDKFNDVKNINIPADAKKAQTFEDYQKEMQKKSKNPSSN